MVLVVEAVIAGVLFAGFSLQSETKATSPPVLAHTGDPLSCEIIVEPDPTTGFVERDEETIFSVWRAVVFEGIVRKSLMRFGDDLFLAFLREEGGIDGLLDVEVTQVYKGEFGAGDRLGMALQRRFGERDSMGRPVPLDNFPPQLDELVELGRSYRFYALEPIEGSGLDRVVDYDAVAALGLDRLYIASWVLEDHGDSYIDVQGRTRFAKCEKCDRGFYCATYVEYDPITSNR